MEINRAKDILSVLAEGINPITGEELPPTDSCNQGDVLRAIQTAISVLDKQVRIQNLPENAGKPWTKEDEETLVKMFNDKCSRRDICRTLNRTHRGVAIRLVHLGLIRDRYEF